MKWVLLVLTLALVGLVTFGTWLLGSSGGASWLVGQLASRTPGLVVEGVGGTISTTLSADRIHYRNASIELAATEGQVQLEFDALFERKIVLGAVRVDTLDVRTFRSEDASASEARFRMPWMLVVDSLTLSQLDIYVGDGARQRFTGVNASARLYAVELAVDLAAATHELGRLAGDFQLQFEPGYPYSGSLEVTESPLFIADFNSASVNYRGSTKSLTLNATVGPAAVLATLIFEGTTTLEASATVPDFQLDGINVRGTRLGASGQMDNLALGVTGQLVHALGQAEVEIAAHLQPDLLLIDRATASGSQGNLVLTGTLDLARRELRAAFDGVLLDKQFAGNAVIGGRDGSDLGGTVYIHQDQNWAVLTLAPSVGLSVNGGLTQLADVYPGLRGALSVNGQLSLQDQQFQLDVTGGRLAYGDWEAQDLVLDANGGLGDEIAADLQIATLLRDGEPMGRGTVSYAGRMDAGTTLLAWRHPLAELDATIDRAPAGLRLMRGLLKVQENAWQLAAPAEIVVTETGVNPGDQCWTAAAASVCLADATFGAAAGAVTINASGLVGAGLQLNRLALGVSYATVNDRIKASLAGDASLAAGGYEGELQLAGSADPDLLVLDNIRLTSSEVVLEGSASYTLAGARLVAEIGGSRLGRRIVAVADAGFAPLDGSIRVSIGETEIFSLLTLPEGMTAKLLVPDLAMLAPGLGGSVEGEGQLDRQHEDWTMRLVAPALTLGNNQLRAVLLQAAGRRGTIADAGLAIEDWQTGAYSLGAGSMSLQGDSRRAELGMKWRYAGNAVEVSSALALQGGVLNGKLLRARITGAKQDWVMDSGVSFEVSANRGRVEDHCWRFDAASLCVAGVNYGADALDFGLRLMDAPVELQDIYAAPETRLDGRLSAALAGRIENLSASPLVTADFSVAVPDGELSYFDEKIAWTLKGGGTIASNMVDAELLVESDAENRFVLTLDWPTLLAPDQFQLQGDLSSNSLGVVTAFVPQLDRAVGTIDATLALDTRDGTPKGHFSLDVGKGASVVVPIAGITLEDVTLHAEGNEELVTIAFGAGSGDGKVQGKGQVTSPLSAERELELMLTGENFVAVQRPELSVIASPALEFRYQGTGTAQLAGHLDVTGGNFRLEDLGIQPRRISSDVTVLARKIPNQAFYQLDLGVGLTINNFAVELYGLRGKVDGGLSLVQRPRLPRRVVGTVNLRDGSFTRYGQNFAVERGRLIFAGPINNPIVDVVSSRSIDSLGELVKVSLLLSGPANNIRSQLVSSPAMSEAQALSYLVLGRSLSGASAADGQSISLAALALGVKGVAPVTEQLKSTLGLTALTLESRGVDGTMVIAGKQINPGLYVEYSYDVLGRVGGILFSYRLNDKFSLETRTGEDSSMQLIYRLE